MPERKITPRDNMGPPINDEALPAFDRHGWVAVARVLRDHWLVGFGKMVEPCDEERGFVYSRGEAWLDLIMECRYAAGTVNNGGRRMVIKPGQLIGAVSYLGHRWNWSPKTVRGFLEKLQDEGMIERFTPGTTLGTDEISDHAERGKQKGKQSQVITLCNWDFYQLVNHMEGQAKRQAKGEQGASTGQAQGTQGASEGQQYKEEQGNKGTQEQESPPTPQGEGSGEKDLLGGEVRRTKADRAEETRLRNLERARTAATAFDIYNKAAAHFEFAYCEVLSPARQEKLLRRLDEIGGVERFRLALRQVGKDDFLSGKRAGRDGTRFKLTFDRLLQTEGGLGDVLARLLDLANAPVELEHAGKKWGWWRPDAEKIRKHTDAAYWRTRLDEAKPNGTWPWWDLGAPPGHEECLVHPDVVTERGLVELYQGKIAHEEGH